MTQSKSILPIFAAIIALGKMLDAQARDQGDGMGGGQMGGQGSGQMGGQGKGQSGGQGMNQRRAMRPENRQTQQMTLADGTVTTQ